MELYDRLIRLKDAALVSKDASLLSASYDCALDGLVALHLDLYKSKLYMRNARLVAACVETGTYLDF